MMGPSEPVPETSDEGWRARLMGSATAVPHLVHLVWAKLWRNRYVVFGALAVNLLVLGQFYPRDKSPFTPSAVAEQIFSPSVLPPPSLPPIFTLNDYDFYGPYIAWPLARVCKETKWTPGLVFVCDNNSGGIGNIRNFILTCIRYAIDAGATGLTMPGIQQRSEGDLSNIFTDAIRPFDYFFDEAHFRSSLKASCPQIEVYNNTGGIPNASNRMDIKEFYPKDLGDLDCCDGRGVNRHLDMFRSKFDHWLNTTRRTPTAEEPVTIRLKWATFFEWPIYRDGPEFAASFGSLLRLRKDVSDLAAKTLFEMSKYIGVQQPRAELDVEYLGIHLRTENDALEFWPNFDAQSEGYLKEGNERGLKYAYLACGNSTDAHRFAEKAWSESRMNVTTKLDLLKGEDLMQLQRLSWDQQALVDFLVLLKSTHFTGCSFSSFAMNIAFKRHLMTGGLQTRPWRSPGDQYNTLVGRYNLWFGDWMFMYECMWP